MKVMIKRVGENPEVVEMVDDLKSYQEIVGGYIEVFPLWDGILCICNEEGKLKGLPPNFACYNDVICGDVIFVSEGGEDFLGLNDVQIEMLNIIFN